MIVSVPQTMESYGDVIGVMGRQLAKAPEYICTCTHGRCTGKNHNYYDKEIFERLQKDLRSADAELRIQPNAQGKPIEDLWGYDVELANYYTDQTAFLKLFEVYKKYFGTGAFEPYGDIFPLLRKRGLIVHNGQVCRMVPLQ